MSLVGIPAHKPNREPKYICECKLPMSVKLVRLECGHTAEERDRPYFCPKHGATTPSSALYAFCFSCRGRIE